MMRVGAHPDDLDLFEYVEGELGESRRPEVAVHLASCPRCAEEVRALEAGKAALRAAPLLQLPRKRREAMLERLPRRERTPFLTPKRLLAILTPVAAVAAVVTVLAGPGGDDGSGEALPAPASATASEALPEAGGEREAGAQAATTEAADAAQGSLEAAPPAVLVSVEGPPEEIVRVLREAGFDARVVGEAVEVRGVDDPAVVELALAGRSPGDVPVRVR